MRCIAKLAVLVAGPLVLLGCGKNPIEGQLRSDANQCDFTAVQKDIDAGVDVNAAESDSRLTAIMSAASSDRPSNGCLKVVKLLIGHRANVNAADFSGRTVLMGAIGNKDADRLIALISAGANVNAADKAGRTPLTYTVLVGDSAAAKILIHAGADPRSKDNLGQTPLHEAALSGDLPLAEILLDAGADPRAKDDLGRTPLDVATATLSHPTSYSNLAGVRNIAELLRRRGMSIETVTH
jgi:ankyrin repeat protein